ncbi:MAG: hypothetical protein ACOX1P_21585 [Thermoguttaceae bacterium]
MILAFAEQTGRTFRRHGGPFEAALVSLPDDVELCEEQLPGEPAWEAAVDPRGKNLRRGRLAAFKGGQRRRAGRRGAQKGGRRERGVP